MEPKYHICILEEDPYIAGLYARKFTERGWKVTVAEREEEARSCLEKRVDLLILDIEGETYEAMPLIRELRRANSIWATLPIVVMTNVSDREKITEAMRLEISAYLMNGHFVPKEVVEKVQRILEASVV